MTIKYRFFKIRYFGKSHNNIIFLEENMKRILSLLLIAVFAVAFAFGGGAQPAPRPAATAAAQELSYDELVAAAKAEGRVVVYSITSRIAPAAAKFQERYGIRVENSNLNDGQLIQRVSTEVAGGVQGADFVISQDSGRVFGQLINTGHLVNYVPPRMRNVIPEKYQNPLVMMHINKIFAFNSERGTAPVITNIWEVTEPKWRGLVQFKDPNTEGVNFNFLTMITSPYWADKLASAYQSQYGRPITLSPGIENAGYEWIKRWFENGLVMTNSDTAMSENIGMRGQPATVMGLFAYTKTRFEEVKNLALEPLNDIEPFSGFYYPAFLHLTANARHPNAAKLFIEFLLTEEGFASWAVDVGTYSSNPNIPLNSGDFPITYWESRMVPEDPEFIFRNRAKVEQFTNNVLFARR
jgi:iron(III) transport system substrate-binding protein